MGDACSSKNLQATIRAASQAGGDLFTEAARLNELDGEQRFHYEKFMASTFGIKPTKTKKQSIWDATQKLAPKSKLTDSQSYDRPSEMFSKRFYGSIDRKVTAWNNSKDNSMAAYNEKVAKPIRTVIKSIDNILATAKSNNELNRRLKPLGLDVKTVYQAKNYLNWLAEGGHMKPAKGFIQPLNKIGSNLAKAQANFNMLWSLGNGVDMIRVYSNYLTRKPTSVANVIKGTIDAIQATRGIPTRRIPELAKAGVYESNYQDRSGGNRTPFEWSITAQKNLTYFLDKASGGDGISGITKNLFDAKPWDRPYWDRVPEAKLVFDLARYPINEARWLLQTGNAARKGDMREITNLLTYGLAKAFFTGTVSLIPAAAWQVGMSKDDKEFFKALDEKLPVNVIRKGSRAIFNGLGIPAELDLSGYTQPFGGQLGSRAQSITRTTGQAFGSGVRAIGDLSKGKPAGAFFRGTESALAWGNLTGWMNSVKVLDGFNSVQLTNLMDTMAKEMEGELGKPGQLQREFLKDIFGTTSVKKTEEIDDLDLAL